MRMQCHCQGKFASVHKLFHLFERAASAWTMDWRCLAAASMGFSCVILQEREPHNKKVLEVAQHRW